MDYNVLLFIICYTIIGFVFGRGLALWHDLNHEADWGDAYLGAGIFWPVVMGCYAFSWLMDGLTDRWEWAKVSGRLIAKLFHHAVDRPFIAMLRPFVRKGEE